MRRRPGEQRRFDGGSYDDDKRVYQQDPEASRSTRFGDFDDSAKTDGYRCSLDAPVLRHLIGKQVISRPDLILAMHWCGDPVHVRARRPCLRLLRAADGSELVVVRLTPRPCSSARDRPPDLAHDYLNRSRIDGNLSDLEHNSRDGLHIASLAGAWIALVAGFGGMR